MWQNDAVGRSEYEKNNCLTMQRPVCVCVCVGDKCTQDKSTARGQWRGWNISLLFTAAGHVLINQPRLLIPLIDVYLNSERR